jgi:hypothetical protein
MAGAGTEGDRADADTKVKSGLHLMGLVDFVVVG